MTKNEFETKIINEFKNLTEEYKDKLIEFAKTLITYQLVLDAPAVNEEV